MPSGAQMRPGRLRGYHSKIYQLLKSETGFSFKFKVFLLVNLHKDPESVFSFVDIAPTFGGIAILISWFT